MAQDLPPVIIDYFYEPGCPNCRRVRESVLPGLEERFEGFYELRRHDISVKTNFLQLVAYEETLGVKKSEDVSMYVDYQYVFSGYHAMTSGLYARIDRCVEARLDSAWRFPQPIAPQAEASHNRGPVRRESHGTVWVVCCGVLALALLGAYGFGSRKRKQR